MRRAGAAGRAAHAEPPGPIPLRSTALDLALITVAWWAFVAFASGGGPAVGYDSFRDIGYAHGIASGHPWEDPMIPGLPAWYPPGIPAVVAAIGAVTGLACSRRTTWHPYDALRRRFNGWPQLERLHEQDTTAVLFGIRPH